MSDDPKSLLRLKGWLITINTVVLLIVLEIVFAWAIPARAQGQFLSAFDRGSDRSAALFTQRPSRDSLNPNAPSPASGKSQRH
jgi:hypothetical protein